MNEKKAAYDKEYQRKNIKQINVPFNGQTPEDVEILKWLSKQGNKTAYIKALIARDMKAAKEFKL